MKKSLKSINIVLKDKQRKSLIRIFFEVIQYLILHWRFPSHYFSRFLYRKNAKPISEFYTNKTLTSIWKDFNNPYFIYFLSNKLMFYYYFKNLDLNVPDLLGYSIKNKFFDNNGVIEINNPNDLETYLYNKLELSADKSIFLKRTYSTSGGTMIFKLNNSDFPFKDTFKQYIFERILASSYIIQSTVTQHPEMSKFHPESLNSIRIDTYLDKNSKPEIFASYLRMGIGGSYLDNVSKGGIFVGIDIENETLKEVGYTTIAQGYGETFLHHPDSGITFKGFKIPFYDKAKELALKAAVCLPNVRLIGWDIAITNEGPIIVEGNNKSNLLCSELAYGGFKNSIVFDKIMNEIKTTS